MMTNNNNLSSYNIVSAYTATAYTEPCSTECGTSAGPLTGRGTGSCGRAAAQAATTVYNHIHNGIVLLEVPLALLTVLFKSRVASELELR